MCSRDWETQTGLNCVGVNNTPGADHIATFYKADQVTGLVGSTANTVISNIIAYGLMYATTLCDQGSYIRQSVNISCDADMGTRVSTNPNCTYCRTQIERVIQDRISLESLAASLPESQYTPQEFTAQQLQDLRATCNYVCSQCLVVNLNQELSATMTLECDVTSNQFQKAFVFGMKNQAKIEVERNRDKLKQMGTKLESDNEIDRFSVSMVDSIRNIITSSTLQSIKSQAIIMQGVTIEPGSTSVLLQNVTQRLSLAMYSTLVSSHITQSRMMVAIDYKTKSKVIELQSSLTEFIDNTVLIGVTVFKLLSRIVEQVPSLVMVIVGVVFLLIFYQIFIALRAPILLHAGGKVLQFSSAVKNQARKLL